MWRRSEACLAAALLASVACGGTGEVGAGDASDGPETRAEARPGERVREEEQAEAELPADWDRFRETVAWAWRQGLDTLPMGETVARIGERLVGTPYRPHTLELPGRERLVVNLRALDCVTFVENALALARFVRTEGPSSLDDEEAYRARYRRILTSLRYRSGEIAGYPSRLHYFSEWIADNDARGQVRDVTAALGGVKDAEPVEFMSAHPEAYRQLSSNGKNLEAIRRVETRLSREGRTYIPQDRVGAVARGIRTGDVIAATSTVPGLDVAHTGIALWRDGRLLLMHAPLVGEAVQISRRTLAERIAAIDGQDGIMVARPLAPEGG